MPASNAVPHIPTTVAVASVASSAYGDQGVTVDSFAAASANSICFACKDNRINELVKEAGHFALNILSRNQSNVAFHFKQPVKNAPDEKKRFPFDQVPHTKDELTQAPIMSEAVSVFVCKLLSQEPQGDGKSQLWIGEIIRKEKLNDSEPMIFTKLKYSSVYDDVFIECFEDTTMFLRNFDHRNHIRMAWNYVKWEKCGEGYDAALRVSDGIRKLSVTVNCKGVQKFHATITAFFTHMTRLGVSKQEPEDDFEDFLGKNPELSDPGFLAKYYSKAVLGNPEARKEIFKADVCDLPTLPAIHA